MAREDPVFLTRDGLKKLEAELEHLKTTKRKEIAERIRFAKDGGDISDNIEFEDAKQEQGQIEGRILQLERSLRNAVLIDESQTDKTTVRVGLRVTVTMRGGKERSVMIVGSPEADPATGRISNESPMGKALLGRKVGEKVHYNTPGGLVEVDVVAIGE